MKSNNSNKSRYDDKYRMADYVSGVMGSKVESVKVDRPESARIAVIDFYANDKEKYNHVVKRLSYEFGKPTELQQMYVWMAGKLVIYLRYFRRGILVHKVELMRR